MAIFLIATKEYLAFSFENVENIQFAFQNSCSYFLCLGGECVCDVKMYVVVMV